MSRSKRRRRDPHAKREAAKYDNPIASREFILDHLDKAGSPLTHEKLCVALGLEDYDEQEALRRRLIAMERDGQVIRDRRGAYGRVDKMDLLRGKVIGHRDGYGWFAPVEGGDDLYLPARQMQKVFDGDEVLVRPTGFGFKGRREATIVEIIAHNTQEVVGRFFQESGIQFVRPENGRISFDILIPPHQQDEAKPGQYVVAAITQQPGRNNPPTGKIIQVLGDHMAPGMEIEVAIRSHGIPHVWPQTVEQAAKQFGATVYDQDKRCRVDLRHLNFVTIDGEDARDFDDAVYCEPLRTRSKKSNGWRLWVAIADVSTYVTPDSALDQEAQLRGTSVYFPDYVIPMLPEELSNGLCSLNPEVDRLVVICEMTLSASGRVTQFEFYEGVIHSKARLTYTKVAAMLEERNNKNSLRQQYKQVVSHIDDLHSLFALLRQERDKRGAIDFETVETKIIFDQQRKIKRIEPVHRNDAHKMIEECMLCANVSAAQFLQQNQIPGLYRVHEGPKEEKLVNLREFLAELGLYLPGGAKPKPEHYQEVLTQIEDRPDAHLIQTVMLRSMQQAVYQAENEGHFGLNYPAYTHFTSPIRRYPDLLVHRAIRHLIRSRKSAQHVQRVKGAKTIKKEEIYPYELASLVQLGEHCSLTERRADEATRDAVSWLKCEFLQDHVGDQFNGVVTGVTGFGLFVELEDLYVEGLVHITSLPRDYYHYEQAQHRLIGEHTRRVFRLGDELLVQVAAVKLEERKVDFELIESKKTKTKRLSKKELQSLAKQNKDGDKQAGRRKSGKSQAGSKSKSGKSRGGKKRH